MTIPRRPTVAILLSTDTFESFFERRWGMTLAEYLDWEGGWSASYCRMLRDEGFRTITYIPSRRYEGVHGSGTANETRFLPVHDLWAPWDRAPILSRGPAARYVAQRINALAFSQPLWRALREDETDVLLVQEYWTGRFDYLATRSPVPVVGVDQGFTGEREVKLFKRRAFHRAAAVITQTAERAERLKEFGAAAAHIPNGVQTGFFTPPHSGQTREASLVFSVAQLNDAHKRLSDLIRALGQLPASWRLEIAGVGNDRDYLERVAAEASVEDRVTFLGLLTSREALRERLRAATVFVLPSAREGLPMALLEAMSCGTPVVGTDIAAIAEVVSDGVDGLLVPLGAPEAIARRIQEAATRASSLGDAARAKVADRFSESTRGRELGALLSGIAATSSRGTRAPAG